MRQVIEYYGGAIIAGLVALAVMSVFARLSYQDAYGVPQILGDMVLEQLQDTKEETAERAAFTDYMGTAVPEIVIADSYACVAAKWTMVEDCLQANDEAGNALQVRVLSGTSAGNSSGRMYLASSGTRIYCTTPGIYWVYASVEMPNGRSREIKVKLIANKEANT